jgi:hypothetical protein
LHKGAAPNFSRYRDSGLRESLPPHETNRKMRMRCPAPVLPHGRTANISAPCKIARSIDDALYFYGDSGLERGFHAD